MAQIKSEALNFVNAWISSLENDLGLPPSIGAAAGKSPMAAPTPKPKKVAEPPSASSAPAPAVPAAPPVQVDIEQLSLHAVASYCGHSGQLPAGDAVAFGKDLAAKLMPGLLQDNTEELLAQRIELAQLIATNDKKLMQTIHKVNKGPLEKFVFLGGNTLNLADLLTFPLFYNLINSWDAKTRAILCNIVRWFDYMQHYSKVNTGAPLIADLDVTLQAPVKAKPTPAPKAAGKEPAKKAEAGDSLSKKVFVPGPPSDAPAAAPAAPSPAAVPKQADPAAEPKRPEAKPKGEPKAARQKGEGGKPAKAKAAAGSDSIDISKLDIRVGKIISASTVDGSDKLYVEMIDVGENVPRQICSGIRQFLPLDRVKDRDILVVCNLKPAKMAGVPSAGMVLCVKKEEQLDFVQPPPGARPGDRLACPPYEGVPAEPGPLQKKKMLEQILPHLHSKDDLVAYYKDAAFTVNGQPCTTSLVGSIS